MKSHQRATVRIVQASRGHHDEFDEAQMPVMMEPSPSVSTVMSSRRRLDRCVQVEFVDAKDAKEQGEENADQELLWRVCGIIIIWPWPIGRPWAALPSWAGLLACRRLGDGIATG